jgi:hypothetical protein
MNKTSALKIKKKSRARCQWLNVILATLEANIRRIEVQGQLRHLGKLFVKTPSPKKTTAKIDWWLGSSRRVPALQAQSPKFKPSPIK